MAMQARVTNVRFAPESGQTAEASICPLCANRVITHCSKRHRLFDHLVGAQQERSRDRQPQMLRLVLARAD